MFGQVGQRVGAQVNVARDYVDQRQVVVEPGASPEALRRAYLYRVAQQTRRLPLAGVDSKAASDEGGGELQLSAVYTALLTQRPEMDERAFPKAAGDQRGRRLSALEVLNREPHLVLLGEPGSGKSTFPRCRFLVTSRTYAYQRQDWKLDGFSEAVLSPFTPAQVTRFVDGWYAHVGAMRGMDAQDAQGRADAAQDGHRAQRAAGRTGRTPPPPDADGLAACLARREPAGEAGGTVRRRRGPAARSVGESQGGARRGRPATGAPAQPGRVAQGGPGRGAN